MIVFRMESYRRQVEPSKTRDVVSHGQYLAKLRYSGLPSSSVTQKKSCSIASWKPGCLPIISYCPTNPALEQSESLKKYARRTA
eukprot:COSAG01_NODE_719_length_14073_cov_30.141906_8_plen_84_part_00